MVGRVILIVLDSVGIGSLPDAKAYGDEGSHTLGHIVEKVPGIQIPNLLRLGLSRIQDSRLPLIDEPPLAAFGRAAEKSAGKDTTTGHWEIAGTVLDKPFPTFTEGFPASFIQAFEKAIGVKTIGNVAASGTEIIQQLGDEHVQTGFPIVYTSADSVFQIAMHESVIPLERQYGICAIARDMLTGDMAVGRVIARPFTGEKGHYTRTSNRKDFAFLPPDNVLTALEKAGHEVIGVGKISDIFAGKNVSVSYPTKNNRQGIQTTLDLIREGKGQLIFTNLVDFDMLYGHRRDPEGYAGCLEEFDQSLPGMMAALGGEDVLIITADHGNDPTWQGTDHTREYIPLLVYGKGVRSGTVIGTRASFADIAATIAEALGVEWPSSHAVSFWKEISF